MTVAYNPDRHFRMQFTKPQSDFILSEAEFPLFVGGFGSGKSTTMAANVVYDLISFPGANIGCYSPTFDLLSLITVPYVGEILEGLNLKYNYHGGRNMFIVEGYGNIICRSLNNPARIVGYQVFRSHIDELDTLPKDKAEASWNKIIARNRQKAYDADGNMGKNRVSAYTTPEGFLFTYDRWEKNPVDGYELYRAPTYSNPHLPPDYIDNLKKTYPLELIDAYIEGLFVNLTSGSVYRNFDRNLNGTTEVAHAGETLHVGMDFNVLYGASAIHVIRDGNPIAVGEIHNSYDTDQQILTLKENWDGHPIIVYPDASGDSRSSANTTKSDIAKLKLAGFKVKKKNKNPPIKDRISAFNGLICSADGNRRYKVNTMKCPELTAALEQQVYDRNGMPDKSSGLDHITDAAGYFVEHEYGLTKPKAKLKTVQGAY
jgi:hypothetical protein